MKAWPLTHRKGPLLPSQPPLHILEPQSLEWIPQLWQDFPPPPWAPPSGSLPQ